MTFKNRLAKAHNELENAGIWRSNYNPPPLGLLRKLGYSIPPPHYRSFLVNFFSHTLFFSLLWGGGMWLFVWQPELIDVRLACAITASVSLFVAFFMSVYYKFSAKRHQLSNWAHFK